ncbi:MAG: hypothetical protein JRH06_06585 [Deltaproteobacteria bacterium]|nr:hypothetical protein [Deltaproteobacteria bacterium]MBW2137206.1 hypothetical protein [Deltaproteobacteria bacterium]
MPKNIQGKSYTDSQALQGVQVKGPRISDSAPMQDEVVKLNIDIECSRDFVEKLLREYTLTVKSASPHERQLELSYSSARKRNMLVPDRGNLLNGQSQLKEPSATTRKRQRWVRGILLSIQLVILVFAGAFVGRDYLTRNEKGLSSLTKYNSTARMNQAYRTILSQNLNILLTRLDQLTSIPRMREAFPEITSLPDIVRTKRGPKPFARAKAAIEYIWRVKELFDRWVKRSQDFPPGLKPTQEDISHFLSQWRKTRVLLDRIESAKEQPERH